MRSCSSPSSRLDQPAADARVALRCGNKARTKFGVQVPVGSGKLCLSLQNWCSPGGGGAPAGASLLRAGTRTHLKLRVRRRFPMANVLVPAADSSVTSVCSRRRRNTWNPHSMDSFNTELILNNLTALQKGGRLDEVKILF